MESKVDDICFKTAVADVYKRQSQANSNSISNRTPSPIKTIKKMR